jgi:hypothetical protein
VSNHFEEIRSHIDQHVAKLNERIGDIAFKMKEEATIYEEIYSKSLKKSFSLFDDSQSLEHELNRIEENVSKPRFVNSINQRNATKERRVFK